MAMALIESERFPEAVTQLKQILSFQKSANSAKDLAAALERQCAAMRARDGNVANAQARLRDLATATAR